MTYDEGTSRGKVVAVNVRWICGALWYLANNDDNEKRIAEEGGIEISAHNANLPEALPDGLKYWINMMEKHGESNAAVAVTGCAALWKLAGNDDNKKRIAEVGGIEMILSMMEKHGESNAGVAEKGCVALWNLAVNDDNKKRIAEVGGIEMILSMMEKHGESNAEVARAGCGALRNLAINADNKGKILAANGVSMVKRMKSKWASNEGVQTYANGALHNLR